MVKRIMNQLVLGIIILTILSCNQPKRQILLNSNLIKESFTAKNDSTEEIGFLDKGYELVENENIGDLRKGMPENEVTDYLGQPEVFTNPEFSQVNAETYRTMTYTEKGIELTIAAQADSTYELATIQIKSPCGLKTTGGIRIGSTADEVIKAYNGYIDPRLVTNESIVAGSVYGGLFFTLTNKKVSEIYLGPGAE